ncbi:MAG: formate/nitrite family transporter [Dehalococcoidales bacterium]|nr:formate/nitrite family transporter [Dehalococcoidales bacterium]
MANKKDKIEGQATVTRNKGPDLFQSVDMPSEAVERTAQLEAVVQKIGKAVSTEAYPPAEVAQKTEAVGVTKGTRDALSTVILGILAGVFIGLGAMFFTLVTTASGLSFGMNRLVGGIAFCLGLILVVVAGAELFTGNNLIVISWLSGRTSFARLLRNWGLVYFANLAGALSLAWLMYYTYQWISSGNGVGANAVLIANAKVNLSFGTALARGIMCNALVCLAIWLCASARTVTDKILAILFPITAFVACGFEHSIANMYFIPMGILLGDQPAVLTAAGLTPDKLANLNWMGFVNNLIPVTIGNIIGGGVLIGAVYWLAYLGRERTAEMVAARPWMRVLVPDFVRAKPAAAPGQLPEPVRAQIAELIRIKVEKPVALDRAGKALLTVLARAKDDGTFLARLAENPARALEGYDLTDQEKAALASGDIRWVESKIGTLEEPLRTWLTARLTQEKW